MRVNSVPQLENPLHTATQQVFGALNAFCENGAFSNRKRVFPLSFFQRLRDFRIYSEQRGKDRIQSETSEASFKGASPLKIFFMKQIGLLRN